MDLNTFIATKKTMTQVWDKTGRRLPVTVLSAMPCTVTQIKSADKDGYWALQIGTGQKKTKNISQPLKGHLHLKPEVKSSFRYLKEIRLEARPEAKIGEVIPVIDVFKPGDVVNVTGTTKGHGFSGVVKRWGFKGGPKTHGQSDRHRAPGSIGQGTSPGRVHRGKKMAGRFGNQTFTTKNLRIIKVNPQTHEIWIKGTIAGAPSSLVTIHKIGSQSFSGLWDQSETPPLLPHSAPSESETTTPITPVKPTTPPDQNSSNTNT